jgi:hypothetical protein
MAKEGYGNGEKPARGENVDPPMGVEKAVEELHREHPHPYYDQGPFHGTDDHKRHERLGGLTPSVRKP